MKNHQTTFFILSSILFNLSVCTLIISNNGTGMKKKNFFGKKMGFVKMETKKN